MYKTAVYTLVNGAITHRKEQNGNGQNSTPHRIQTTKLITIKLCKLDYVHETNT